MVGDYSGPREDEAQNRAPSTDHVVNECKGELLELQTGTIGNIHTSCWILYWKQTHTNSLMIKSIK